MNEPQWPSGDDPDLVTPQERTGFWSPTWDHDSDEHLTRRVPGNGNRNANGARNGAPQGPAGNGYGPSGEATRHVPRDGARPPGGRPIGPPPGGVRRPDHADAPTELISRVPDGRSNSRGVGPEPNLLTHREPGDDDEPFEDDDTPLSPEQRTLRRKKIWRRVRRTMYVATALMIIIPIVAFFVAYKLVDVPSQDQVLGANSAKVVTLTYADGTTELSKIIPANTNSAQVEYKDIPQTVLDSVFAAEDKDFMTNSGFDLTGVLRAVWNNATGGTGGGSTITQQYIKTATGNDQRTLSRKALELVKAYKMNRTYSKEQIITAYLNTIYFGRHAYGIAGAAKAYFGVPLSQITYPQAALLGGMIQGPGKYKDAAYMQRRWTYVMDQLKANGKISATDRESATFPKLAPLEQSTPQAVTDSRRFIQDQVLDEIENNPEIRLNSDQLQQGGYKIVTTIDQNAQQIAIDSVHQIMTGQPENLHPGLVAVDPKTGEIKAYWGGDNGIGTNWANTKLQPGSSFKPFDLLAFLELPNAKQSKGIDTEFDSTPRSFGAGTEQVRNASKAPCGAHCTIYEAMWRSLNVVFSDLVYNALDPSHGSGPKMVADAAKQAGIQSDLSAATNDINIAIGGGHTTVTTQDMAGAFATFAAAGTKRTPHMVAKILNPDGSVFWGAHDDGTPAFDPNNDVHNRQLARNVTETLTNVPPTSNIPCKDRICAAKTGTNQRDNTSNDNNTAWTVGYTPQISVAVSLGSVNNEPIRDKTGKPIFGAGLPGHIWQAFMNKYNDTFFKKQIETFGKFDPIGTAGAGGSGSSATASTSAKPTTTAGAPTTTTDQPPTTTTDPTTTDTTKKTKPSPTPCLPVGCPPPGG